MAVGDFDMRINVLPLPQQDINAGHSGSHDDGFVYLPHITSATYSTGH